MLCRSAWFSCRFNWSGYCSFSTSFYSILVTVALRSPLSLPFYLCRIRLDSFSSIKCLLNTHFAGNLWKISSIFLLIFGAIILRMWLKRPVSISLLVFVMKKSMLQLYYSGRKKTKSSKWLLLHRYKNLQINSHFTWWNRCALAGGGGAAVHLVWTVLNSLEIEYEMWFKFFSKLNPCFTENRWFRRPLWRR